MLEAVTFDYVTFRDPDTGELEFAYRQDYEARAANRIPVGLATAAGRIREAQRRKRIRDTPRKAR